MKHMEQQFNPERIAVAGGGGGASIMTAGLVEAFPDAEISAVVATGDSGSKTGEIRRVFGGAAVGDIRNVMAAVSGNEAGGLFKYRFGEEDSEETVERLGKLMLDVTAVRHAGSARAEDVLQETARLTRKLPHGLRGHTYGNLVLTALRLDYGGGADDLMPAVAEASAWLDTKARVIPVTGYEHDVILFRAATPSEVLVYGEDDVDNYVAHDLEGIHVGLGMGDGSTLHDTTPPMTMEAYHAIADSDLFVVGPGSLTTSLLPALAPKGARHAVQEQRRHGGKQVMVANLATERILPDAHVGQYLWKLQDSTEVPFDLLVHNTNTADLPADETPLEYHGPEYDRWPVGHAVGADLVDTHTVLRDPNDPLSHARSAVHHNVDTVAQAMRQYL